MTSPTANPAGPRGGTLAAAGGLCSVVVGAAVLAGWLFGVPWLKSPIPGAVSMKANTALAFVLAGAALALLARAPLSRPRAVLGRWLAVAVILLGGATLGEFVFGWPRGLDELLFTDDLNAAVTAIPGRMALPTALAFLLLGLALAGIEWEPRRGFRPAEGLALVSLTLGLISLVELALGDAVLFNFRLFNRMAVHTAVVFLVLSAGVLLARPSLGWLGLTRAGAVQSWERRLYEAAALGLLLVLAGGGWFYRTQEEQLRREVEAKLDSIARSKVDQIGQWRSERLADAAVLTEGAFFTETVLRWMANPQPNDTGRQRILAQFRTLQNHRHYSDILLADANGQVVLSLSGHAGRMQEQTVADLAQAILLRRPILTDLHVSPGEPVPYSQVVAPLFAGAEAGEAPFAAVLLHVEATGFLYGVTQSWPTPTRTAEVLFVRRDGDSVLYLNELRFQRGTALQLRRPLTERNVPAVMAVLGQQGVVEGVDYRGERVLAALRTIPDSPWYMVTKIDVAEALEDWRFRGKLILAVLVLLVGGLGGTIVMVWQQRSKLTALAQSAQVLREREERLRDALGLNEKLVGAATLGILAYDAEGRCVLANEAAVRMVGGTTEQVRAQNFRHVASWQKSGLLAAAEHVLATGEPRRTEISIVTSFQRELVLDCALGRFETGGRPHLLLTFADITERKRAGVLRRQLSTIIESTSDFVATASPEGKLLYFNRTARQMFGLGDDTDPAAWSIEQSHPAWAAKRVLEEGFPAAVRDGTWTGETAFLTHDRREIPHTQVLIAHKAADGSLEMISTVARDISARKRSEELMQARLRLMEAAPAATLDGFLQLALDEIEARTNSTIGFYHFMGADQETLTLQAWSTNTIRHMCTAEGKGSHYAVSKAGVWVDCVRERRPVIHNDYAALAHKKGLPEGHSPIVRELVVPIIRGERIVAIIGVGNKSTGYDQSDVEITTLLGDFSWESVERKRAELRLLEVSRLQKAILDGAGVGIVSATTEGRITTFSTGAEKLLGHAREAMIGINTPVVYHLPNEIQARANELTVSLGEPVAADFAVFAALPRRGQPDEREWTFVRKDGSPVPVWQSITALHDPAGAITGFLSIAQDLTERKRADVALQLSEERLRKVLGQADCLVWEAKVHLTADDWSWRFTIHPSGLYQQLFGEQEPNQSAGLWYQFEIPEQQEMNRRSRQAMESGVPGYVQIFRVIREGRMRWIRESVSITRRESGHCWLVGVATDVTEQKRAEELLKAEENLFRTLMDTSLDRVYFKDLEGRFTRVNQSKLVRHGFTDFSQIIGKTDLETGGGEQARQAHQDEAEIIRTGQPLIDREEYAVYPDGTPCWISSYKYPLRDATGRIIGTFGISRDITLRKLAEVELQQSLSQLQATLQSTADGILVVNSAGRITLYNQRFLEFGRIPDGMLESDDDAPVLLHIFSQMKHPEAFLARVKAIYAAPGCDSTDLLELKDGRIFERYSRPQLVDGHPAGRVWSFRDVTLERQAEAAKEKLLGELSRSNTDLEQFAYVASHDLKSPLRAIDSLAGWLQEDLAEVLVGDSRKHLDLLRQRTRRMERLLDDLLAYSRAGRVPADIVRVDVARLLAEIVEMIGAPAGFVVQARPPLPVFATAVTPLRQVLTNLIANAIKHHDRPAGGIELAVREAGEWYEFTVADDGPGIAPEFHERIFGMFQTLRPRDEVEGSGIGLALVRRIVTRYGGTAEVECRQPRGSRFRFTWPRQIPTDDSHFA